MTLVRTPHVSSLTTPGSSSDTLVSPGVPLGGIPGSRHRRVTYLLAEESNKAQPNSPGGSPSGGGKNTLFAPWSYTWVLLYVRVIYQTLML